MQVPIEQITELERLEEVVPRRGPSRRVRHLLHRLRLVWTVFFGLATLALAAGAVLGPADLRWELGALGGLAALMLLFLIREERAARATMARERYLWLRLRDLSQIFEVVLGVRSHDDVRSLAGLGLQESMLLLRSEYGALILQDTEGDDHVTVLGYADRNYDHRPWLIEVQNMLRGLAVNVPVFVPNVSADPHFGSSAMLEKAGIGALAAVRFGNGSEAGGLMVVANPRPSEFRYGDDKTFELAARVMTSILRHGRKLDELSEVIADLKREVDELTYANQAKSEFASVASHELKTPLTAVKASVDTLLANVRRGDYEALEEFLLVIREEADRLIDMTGKILEISALDYSNRVMERRPVRLRRVVDSCAQALEVHLQEKDMHLQVDVPLDLPPVFADPGMVRQVLINLIGNAIKFSTSGQSVTVTAQREGEGVQVRVIDEGIGIPEDEQPHIFDRFFQGSHQGDNHIQSTGLGLAIVKEIVEQHQGHVSVESRPGAGATFCFDLPLARDSFGLEGTPLDFKQSGEVEEFLRLALDWISHVSRADGAMLFIGGPEELQLYWSTEECENLLEVAKVATRAMSAGSGILLAGEGTSLVAVPLYFRDQVAGCFVARRESPPFPLEDQLLVEGIVDRISRVLAEAAAQRDPGRQLRRAMRAVRDLLQNSQRRVPMRVDPSLLAWELADRAGADRELARDVRLATNFHDVAMAQIGLDIEKQERPLSDTEQERLHEHPRQAARLLEDIQAMESVSQIVLHHHEWYDGAGYPDGLAGSAIPLGARIVAIIDAYCSMTTPRKYKPVHEPLDAARELVRCSGRQFDPSLVRLFLGILEGRSWLEPGETEALLIELETVAAERLARSGGNGQPAPTASASVATVPADNESEEGLD